MSQQLWVWRAPSATCETWSPPESRTPCGKDATHAYPAMGGGYHAMCEAHAEKHRDYCVTMEEARRGKLPTVSRRAASPRAGT